MLAHFSIMSLSIIFGLLFMMFLMQSQTVFGQVVSSNSDIIIQNFTFSPIAESNGADEFYLQLILVIIPTVGAFITTKFVAETWQDRKEKYRLQKEILSEIDNSILHYLDAMYIFAFKIRYEYIYGPGGPHKGEDFIQFPDDNIAEQPEQKFKKDFEEFDKEISEMRKRTSKFESTLDLYYGDDDLKEEWRNLRDYSIRLNEIFDEVYYSTTKEDYEKNWEEFFDASYELRDKITAFRKKILEKKLKKYQI